MSNPKLTPTRLPFKSIGQATRSVDYQSDGISNDIECFVEDQSKVLFFPKDRLDSVLSLLA